MKKASAASKEQQRLLDLASNLGVSRVALQPRDLEKLTDSSSSSSMSGSSDEDAETLTSPPAEEGQGQYRKKKHRGGSAAGSPRKRAGDSRDAPVPDLDNTSSLGSDSYMLNDSSDSDNTLHLSLPGSFDDTLNFDNIALNVGLPSSTLAMLAKGYDAHGASKSGAPSVQKLLDRISDLEQALTKQKLRHDEELSHVKRRHDDDQARQGTDALERDRELTLMQQRLSDRKENFRDLAISDSLFQELDSLPESQLTLKEFVCVSVYRTTHRYKDEVAKSRAKSKELADQLNSTTDVAETNLREAMRARKLAEGREESLRLDLTASEDRLKEVEGKVRDFQRTVADLRERGRKYDEVLARAKTAEKKYDDLRKLAEDQGE